MMKMGGDLLKWLFIILLALVLLRVDSVSAVCELSFTDHDKRINYSLATPLPMFPHGVLSEDGFYKVAVNETVLWFQLCNEMLFNHDPPRCVDCLDCGGPSRCGTECSALVANNIDGYDVCNTIGLVSRTNIKVMDKKNPHKGVIVNMSNIGRKQNCSLSVTVICDQDGVQGPQSMEKLGTCDFATVLRHPAGCATVVSIAGRGLGWFGTFITIIFCLFGSYLLAGTVYRFFFLGVRGVNVGDHWLNPVSFDGVLDWDENDDKKWWQFQTWILGPAYRTEHRVFLHLWYGDLEDRLKGIEAPILVSTFEQLQACSRCSGYISF
ncbi:hypothetical protein Pint_06581 [Pistacia integerrima]|uniref:Uncharacterized protein n=1 Tax=Pistacia integerrima TaxID=434235 RepID=A0ACC0Z300_9ROSI|nr:hypothetical protein Pint_06581 [Pistacia integerrima]